MTDTTGEYQERLRGLQARRGTELVSSLINEIGELHREISRQGRELAALAEYQRARDRWLALEVAETRRRSFPRTVTIEADHALNGRDGFHGIEYSAKGVPFRWTGPSAEFTFNVFVDRTQGARLELNFINCMNFDLQKDLVVAIDGETVAVEITPNGLGFDVVAAVPRSAESRATLISVFVHVMIPNQGGDDSRLLGLAFTRLSVVSHEVAELVAPADAGKTSAASTVRGENVREANAKPVGNVVRVARH